MTNILAIDTSTEACSVAVFFNHNLIHDFTISQRDHTKQILPMVDGCLNKAGCILSDIDAIAFTSGPGSFTGVRIGIGIAQGLSFGINKPLISISTLEVLAQGVRRAKNASNIIAAIDARMGEVYLGAYHYNKKNECELIIKEQVIKPELVNECFVDIDLDKTTTYVCGTGWQTYPNMIEDLQLSDCVLPTARDMIDIALKKYQSGDIVTPENAEATYLRNEVTWNKLPGRG